MKIRITFKTPDAVDDAINDLELDENLDEEAKLEVLDSVTEFINKFVKYGELITVEFDTEDKTATVVSR